MGEDGHHGNDVEEAHRVGREEGEVALPPRPVAVQPCDAQQPEEAYYFEDSQQHQRVECVGIDLRLGERDAVDEPIEGDGGGEVRCEPCLGVVLCDAWV